MKNTKQNIAILAEYNTLNIQSKAIESRLNELKEFIKIEMAAGREDEKKISETIGEFAISLTLVSAKRLDTELLKAELPLVYERYSKETTSSRLSIKRM